MTLIRLLRLAVLILLGSGWGLLPTQVRPAGGDSTAAEPERLVDAALDQVGVTTAYDPATD